MFPPALMESRTYDTAEYYGAVGGAVHTATARIPSLSHAENPPRWPPTRLPTPNPRVRAHLKLAHLKL